MTVKAKVGRTRYVVFQVAPSPMHRQAITDAMPPAARLTRFDGSFGIARTTHTQRDAVVEALNAVTRVGGREARIVTVATSGTLKGAARRLPPESPAAQRGPRPPRPAKRAAPKPGKRAGPTKRGSSSDD